MKIPKIENIKAANQIHDMMMTWDHLDEMLYLEFENFPKNIEPRKVAYKVGLVDKLYGCNLKVDHTLVVRHIISLKIDPDLSTGNIQAVNRISRLRVKNTKWSTKTGIKNILVFASKYCHFHQRDKFPIWDKFAAIGFGDLMRKNYLSSRNYNEFKTDIDILNSSPSLRLSYRELDKYLWLYGQKVANFNGSSAEVKELGRKYPQLFAQLDPS